MQANCDSVAQAIHNYFSENNRITEVGRALCRPRSSISPSPTLKQGQLEQVTQAHIQTDF